MSDRAATEQPYPGDDGAIRERISRIEWEQQEMKRRLKEGTEAFADLRASLIEVRDSVAEAHREWSRQMQPKPVPGWKIAGFIFSVAVVLGGWVWSLARYPDRDEFNDTQLLIEAEQRRVKDEVEEVKVNQIRLTHEVRFIRDSVERQERRQEKLDDKINKVLEVEKP